MGRRGVYTIYTHERDAGEHEERPSGGQSLRDTAKRKKHHGTRDEDSKRRGGRGRGRKQVRKLGAHITVRYKQQIIWVAPRCQLRTFSNVFTETLEVDMSQKIRHGAPWTARLGNISVRRDLPDITGGLLDTGTVLVAAERWGSGGNGRPSSI